MIFLMNLGSRYTLYFSVNRVKMYMAEGAMCSYF